MNFIPYEEIEKGKVYLIVRFIPNNKVYGREALIVHVEDSYISIDDPDPKRFKAATTVSREGYGEESSGWLLRRLV